MNVKELESQIARISRDPLRDILNQVGFNLPEHWQPRISLLKSNRRKVRSNASAENWSPQTGRIEIQFESVPQPEKQPGDAHSRKAEFTVQSGDFPADTSAANDLAHPGWAELLRALDRAEARPGWSFVPLKKFRDEILPAERPEDMPNLRTDEAQRHFLQLAIEKRLVLVGKLPNPKAPQFPVTTIRLNRLMPEVAAALGQRGSTDLGFSPIEIRGEPLSATILRERR